MTIAKKVFIGLLLSVGSLIVTNNTLALFVYTRTPSGDIIISPATVQIQGVFGVDLCANVAGATGYWIAFSNIDHIDTFTSVTNHAQGDIVDDTFEVGLSPGTYTARLECWRDGHPHAGFGLEGGLTVVLPTPTITVPTLSSLPTGTVNQFYPQQTFQASGRRSLTLAAKQNTLYDF